MKTSAINLTAIILILVFAVQDINAKIININLNVTGRKDNKRDTLKPYNKTISYTDINTVDNLNITYQGKIVVSDNDKKIESISPNGFFEMSKTSFGNERKIKITSDKRGNLTYKYYEGRNEKDFNDDGSDWLSDILQDVVRYTGISAEERVERIYKEDGIVGVLNEIEELKEGNSYTMWMGVYSSRKRGLVNVKNLYFKIMIDKLKMKDIELERVIREIRDVRSNSTKGTLLRNVINNYALDHNLQQSLLRTTESLDYNTERGSVLRHFMAKYKITERNTDDFFDVVDGMSINSEKGNVIKPLLKTQKLDEEAYLRMLQSVSRFSSPSEQCAILYNVVDNLPKNDRVKEAFIETVRSISSSYYLMKDDLILALVKDDYSNLKSDKTVLKGLLRNAKDYSSNSKKFMLLRKVNRAFITDADFVDEYFEVIETMDNEMLRYNILIDLVATNKLDDFTQSRLYKAAEDLIEEDYRHGGAAVLREAIPQLSQNKSVVYSYFEAVEELDMDGTKEELFRLLADKKKITNDLILNIIRAVDDFEVDVEKASVLIHLNKVMPKNDQELDFVYNTIARGIKLPYEYNKVQQAK